MNRGLRWAGGFVLVTHGLVHLLIWPGAPLGTSADDTRLRWNGTSWPEIPRWMPPAVVDAVGGMLLAGAVLGWLFGGLALLVLPGARRFPLTAAGGGAVCSLLLFGLVWPGLEPDPAEFTTGPVLSATLLVGVGLVLVLRRWKRHSGTPAGPAEPAGEGCGQVKDAVRSGTGPTARG